MWQSRRNFPINGQGPTARDSKLIKEIVQRFKRLRESPNFKDLNLHKMRNLSQKVRNRKKKSVVERGGRAREEKPLNEKQPELGAGFLTAGHLFPGPVYFN